MVQGTYRATAAGQTEMFSNPTEAAKFVARKRKDCDESVLKSSAFTGYKVLCAHSNGREVLFGKMLSPDVRSAPKAKKESPIKESKKEPRRKKQKTAPKEEAAVDPEVVDIEPEEEDVPTEDESNDSEEEEGDE